MISNLNYSTSSIFRGPFPIQCFRYSENDVGGGGKEKNEAAGRSGERLA